MQCFSDLKKAVAIPLISFPNKLSLVLIWVAVLNEMAVVTELIKPIVEALKTPKT
jgi:hypothetical protein